jgi:protein-disulfide isomerase
VPRRFCEAVPEHRGFAEADPRSHGSQAARSGEHAAEGARTAIAGAARWAHACRRMKRTVISSFVLLALMGCRVETDRSAQTAPAQDAALAAVQGAVPAEPPAGRTKVPSACDDASLSLPSSEVIAKVDGQPVRVSDLGDDAARAEAEALRTYCGEIDRIRNAALERAVDMRLVEAAAKAAGADVDTWLRGRVDAAVARPSDEEAEAYFDQHKTPEAPPFEEVKQQVVDAMMQERSQEAFDGMLAELRVASEVETMLPDVRPPALEVDVPDYTPTFGPSDAPVEIVEFSDFECPYCARAADALRDVKSRYGDKVRVAYRHFPLSFHPNAMRAAQVAQCAQDQDKFWPLHDAIFASTSGLGGDAIDRAAEAAGLDQAALSACLESSRPTEQVQADMLKARELGVEGTPSFYVNGRPFTGRPTPEGFAAAIEAELARKG